MRYELLSPSQLGSLGDPELEPSHFSMLDRMWRERQRFPIPGFAPNSSFSSALLCFLMGHGKCVF